MTKDAELEDVDEEPERPPTRRTRPDNPVTAFLRRQRDDLIRDGILGIFLAVVAFGLGANWVAGASQRAEALEERRIREQRELEEARAEQLRAIEPTYPHLDGWRARSRSPERPERGSELDTDARIWPWHPPYEVARQSLIAAVQHLNLARTAIAAGEIYPTSHFTVLRGALVGAAQGVWLLAPDVGHERQQRALRVIDEWYSRRTQYNRANDSARLSSAGQARLLEQTRHLEQRRSQARALWASTDTLSANEKLNVTSVITSASADTFTEPTLQVEAGLLWNMMSGDAHALGWPLTLRSRDWTKDRDGLGVGAAGGDLLDIAQPYVASFRLLKRGWSLFDRRAEGAG